MAAECGHDEDPSATAFRAEGNRVAVWRPRRLQVLRGLSGDLDRVAAVDGLHPDIEVADRSDAYAMNRPSGENETSVCRPSPNVSRFKASSLIPPARVASGELPRPNSHAKPPAARSPPQALPPARGPGADDGPGGRRRRRRPRGRFRFARRGLAAGNRCRRAAPAQRVAERLEIERYVAHGLIAMTAILPEALADDPLELRWAVVREAFERRWFDVQRVGDDVRGRPAIEGRMAGHQLVEHRADSPDRCARQSEGRGPAPATCTARCRRCRRPAMRRWNGWTSPPQPSRTRAGSSPARSRGSSRSRPS